MVLGLQVFLLLSPGEVLLVLPLLLLLEIVLQRADLIDELSLVGLVRRHVLLDSDAGLHDVLLELDAIHLAVLVVVPRIVHVRQVVVHDCALVIQRGHSRLKSFDLDFFFRDLHGHLMLLVIEHVLIVG